MAAAPRKWAGAAALFVIHAGRGAGLGALLGEAFAGILCTDRRVVYERVPVGRRQLCRAHLRLLPAD